ncbi:hypothetical protein G0029_16605 (plasmid) [Acinetobacter sp. YH12138]|uniref:Imm41 family immunity protein n=1 Tax=unclassified Acinetobacter TaxID=196816 RepID=UPI0015D376B7|nr:Imm41 family immunity protein [Acinetobacter sp. YH12138]QOW51418.1 hypothetical protein G0029_16605 [Acinetobacter sp. YH12138]
MLENFNRNVTFLDDYDPNCFIGLWIDECVWSDKEYWKLEKDLLSINYHYSNNVAIPRNILCGIMRITQLMIIPNWNDFEIYKEHELYTLNEDWVVPTIFDRYERFKYLLGILFTEEVSLEKLDFGYNLKSN